MILMWNIRWMGSLLIINNKHLNKINNHKKKKNQNLNRKMKLKNKKNNQQKTQNQSKQKNHRGKNHSPNKSNLDNNNNSNNNSSNDNNQIKILLSKTLYIRLKELWKLSFSWYASNLQEFTDSISQQQSAPLESSDVGEYQDPQDIGEYHDS